MMQNRNYKCQYLLIIIKYALYYASLSEELLTEIRASEDIHSAQVVELL
jgi:hypothetical protein